MSNARIGASTCLVLVAILERAGADSLQDAEVTIGAKGLGMLRRTGLQDEHKTVSESVATLKSIQRSIYPGNMPARPHHNDEGVEGFFREHHDHYGTPNHNGQTGHQPSGHTGSPSSHHGTSSPSSQHHAGHPHHGSEDYYYYYEEVPSRNDNEALNWKSQPDKMVPLPHQLDNHIVFPPEVVVVMGPRKECMKTDDFTKMSAHCCSFKFNDVLSFDENLEKMAYRSAYKYCEEQGHRLCTLGEVEAGNVRLPEDMDHPMWTASTCNELHPVVMSNVTVQKETGPPPLEDIPTAATLDELRKTLQQLFGVQKESEDAVKALREEAEANGGKMLPFTMQSDTHDVILEGWNLAIKSQDRRLGEGNLVVGLGHNIQKASNSVVLGEQNTAEGDSVTVAGGWMNKASAQFSSVLGGQHNLAAESYSCVVGGMNNKAEAHGSVVVGGESNIAQGEAAVIGGGYGNSGKGRFASVSGGYMNKADGESSSVGGGSKNEATGTGAAIGGGTDKISSAINYR